MGRYNLKYESPAPNTWKFPQGSRRGHEYRLAERVTTNRQENPRGFGIQEWKNPTKTILSVFTRNFFAVEQIRLFFDPTRGVIIKNIDPTRGDSQEVEVQGGKFISRCFANLGIKSMVVRPEARYETSGLRTLLELAEQEKVFELRESLNSFSFGLSFETEATGDTSHRLIPGAFKHYTNHEGLRGISESGFIRGSWKEKRGRESHYVSLTRLSLSAQEAQRIMYTEGERLLRPDFGLQVIAFDLKDGSPKIESHGSDRSVELWVDGNVFLEDVEISYQGPNLLAA